MASTFEQDGSEDKATSHEEASSVEQGDFKEILAPEEKNSGEEANALEQASSEETPASKSQQNSDEMASTFEQDGSEDKATSHEEASALESHISEEKPASKEKVPNEEANALEQNGSGGISTSKKEPASEEHSSDAKANALEQENSEVKPTTGGVASALEQGGFEEASGSEAKVLGHHSSDEKPVFTAHSSDEIGSAFEQDGSEEKSTSGEKASSLEQDESKDKPAFEGKSSNEEANAPKQSADEGKTGDLQKDGFEEKPVSDGKSPCEGVDASKQVVTDDPTKDKPVSLEQGDFQGAPAIGKVPNVKQPDYLENGVEGSQCSHQEVDAQGTNDNTPQGEVSQVGTDAASDQAKRPPKTLDRECDSEGLTLPQATPVNPPHKPEETTASEKNISEPPQEATANRFDNDRSNTIGSGKGKVTPFHRAACFILRGLLTQRKREMIAHAFMALKVVSIQNPAASKAADAAVAQKSQPAPTAETAQPNGPSGSSENMLSKEEVSKLLKEKGIDPSTIFGAGPSTKSAAAVSLLDCPTYGRFFKMMSVKVPRPAIELKMQNEGLDVSMLDKDPSDLSPIQPAPTAASSGTPPALLKDDPDYGPFFKMIAVKVPRPAVEMKMKQKGLDHAILDLGPDGTLPSTANSGQQGPSSGAKVATTKLKDDKEYGPFIKMLAVKVPRPAVEAKMRSKGLDPKYLDMDPESPAPTSDTEPNENQSVSENGGTQASSAAVTKLKDDKEYGPFLKMLAVKVPRPAVEAKMVSKGLDPKYLDMDPEGPAPSTSVAATEPETNVVKLKDDKDYGPFFKMLAVKVPRPAVENKMISKGLDPKFLDMDPESPAPSAPVAEASSTPAATMLKDDKDYGPFIKMLAVKVPRPAVEIKMRAKGLDPKYLDMDPNSPAPVSSAAPESGSVPAVKLKDDKDYGPFLKMLAVKVPRPAVEAKMRAKGLDPKYLDMDPESAAPAPAPAPAAATAPASGASASAPAAITVKLKDDKDYGPFLKMLAVKVPRPAVEAKMRAKGLDPKYLDMDPDSPAPSSGTGAAAKGGESVSTVKLKDDKDYGPFIKMLSVKVPRPAVEAKMRAKGLDPKYLDADPESPAPSSGGAVAAVKLKDDKDYGPFLKMLAVKVPRPAVEAKMRAKGLDPKYLDMDPESPAPSSATGAGPAKAGGGLALPPKPVIPEKKPDKIMRRKLHWRKIPSRVLDSNDSAVWHKCSRFVFEQREVKELDQFFTLNVSEQERQKAREKAAKAAEGGGEVKVKKKAKEEKKMLLDTQRSNNVSIVLSRLKTLNSKTIRRCLYSLELPDDTPIEDVRSVLGLLPTSEEEKTLKAYTGDRNLLLKAEAYFMDLMDIPRYKQRVNCLLYKMKFDEVFDEASADFEVVSRACTELLESKKFRKLLEMILALGNFMNEGPDAPSNKLAEGFSLDSIGKLRSVKSFQAQTTALHYLVMLIQSREAQVMMYIKSETDSIRQAANVSLTNAAAQVQTLANGIKAIENERSIVSKVVADDEKRASMTDEDKMFAVGINRFYKFAEKSIAELVETSTKTEQLFNDVLAYLCEDSTTTSEVLFRTLQAFFADFELALNQNDAARQNYLRRQKAKKNATAKSSKSNKAAKASKTKDGKKVASEQKDSKKRDTKSAKIKGQSVETTENLNEKGSAEKVSTEDAGVEKDASTEKASTEDASAEKASPKENLASGGLKEGSAEKNSEKPTTTEKASE